MDNTQEKKSFIILFFTKILSGIWTIINVKKKVPPSLFLLRWYIITIFVGTCFLYSPGAIAYNGYITPDGKPYTLLDAFFTAVSAFSDTGLIITPTYEHFTFFGHLIIMILIIVGGVGIISVGMFLLYFLNKKLNLTGFINLNNERGANKLGGSLELIKVAFLVVLFGILLGTIFLSPYLYYNAPNDLAIQAKGNWGNAIWLSMFHSASAINNAGFDIFSKHSLLPFVGDVYVQLIFVILIIVGGIGFPVLYDIWRWIQFKLKKSDENFQWSLFTKITVSAYFLIFFFGLLTSFLLEFISSDPNSLINLARSGKKTISGQSFSTWQVINSIIFTTFSTRNAGFSTIPIYLFQEPTKILWSVLMWIGSSPASTAGGVRTTTFALILIASIHALKGSKRVFAFKRRIPDYTITKSFVVGMTSIMIVIFASGALLIDLIGNTNIQEILKGGSLYAMILFEVSSAFGTTGLSAGLTSSLGDLSKITITLLMIIGQLGVSTTLIILSSTDTKKIDEEIIYGEEEVIIG